MCQDCDCQNNDSGFIFGLVIGAVIGAAVAVYIYKNNKTDVFADFRDKLEKYFKKPVKKVTKPEKIPVIIPSKLIAKTTTPKVIASKPRKFVKK